MKQNLLDFHSEKEFQEFFSLLSAAEIVNFMAVEGSGGDKGFDGIAGTNAFQVYYPEHKNRTKSKYIEKIKKDLKKVKEESAKIGIPIEKWTLVVPEDLRIDIISHLITSGSLYGIQCNYWGASKLKELAYKHPHIIDAFPSIFAPHLRNQIENVRKIINKFSPIGNVDVEIVTDKEYKLQLAEIDRHFHRNVQSAMARLRGTGAADSSSAGFISR